MISIFRALLLCVVLVCSLSACNDHRLGGPDSPIRLRLKTVEFIGGITLSLNYDQSNRLTSYSAPGRGIYFVYYDDQNRYSKIELFRDVNDRRRGVRYSFQYIDTNNSFKLYITDFLDNQGTESYFATYTLNSNKQLVSYKDVLEVEQQFYYTGSNITSSSYQQGSYKASRQTLEYDDKPNPLYGLPAIGNDVFFQNFNKNNITKGNIKTNGDTGFVNNVYEYNDQGLPIKSTSGLGIRFDYESF